MIMIVCLSVCSGEVVSKMGEITRRKETGREPAGNLLQSWTWVWSIHGSGWVRSSVIKSNECAIYMQ